MKFKYQNYSIKVDSEGFFKIIQGNHSFLICHINKLNSVEYYDNVYYPADNIYISLIELKNFYNDFIKKEKVKKKLDK